MNDFPAIQLHEQHPCDAIRELYLAHEPALLAAIRRGDRYEARRMINHVLVHIYSAGQERSDLLKSLLLELVVMISRAAMEAGVAQSEAMLSNFSAFSQLAGIDDDDDLAEWLRETLDRVFAMIEGRRTPAPPPVPIGRALAYMRENSARDISRDDVARRAGVSPSHFSRMMKEHTGWSYTELLRQYRVELACDWLRDETKSLAEIADRCGFCDQSYFTRVFKDVKGMTPRQFRSRAIAQAAAA